MIAVTEDMLREITTKIVDAVNPVSIILFGSHARRNAGSGSDLDFLVVEEQPRTGADEKRCPCCGGFLVNSEYRKISLCTA